MKTTNRTERYMVVLAHGHASDNKHTVYSTHATSEAAIREAKKRGDCMVLKGTEAKGQYVWGDTVHSYESFGFKAAK